jgi:putative oxidoreductase
MSMSYDLGLLLLRLVVGGLLFGHGAQKLFGWFGGHGLAATSAFFGSQLRLRPAHLWTLMAGLTEAGGGLLVALGLLSPLGSLGIVAAMLVAIALVHWGHLWIIENGIEYDLVLIASALAIALTGPGAYSLGAALGIALPALITLLVGLVLVVLGVAAVVGTRAPAAGSTAAQEQTGKAA